MPTERAPADPRRRRVLLGHLISNGDCLYATTVARQIKHDDPGCHLTWAISERCRHLLEGNPDVDEVWAWPTFPNGELFEVFGELERQAEARRARGEFDAVYLSQFIGPNAARWDGTLRSAILRAYPAPITVPVAPVMRLTAREQDHVRQFADRHGLRRDLPVPSPPDSAVILFECAPGSGQSFVTPEFARQAARSLSEKFPGLRVILSSNIAVAETDPRLLDGSCLSFRETADLAHYCSLLVGCSSGLTWVCTSEAGRKLPAVQLLTRHTMNSNPPSLDHERWGLPTSDIVEMYDCAAEHAIRAIESLLTEGAEIARSRFHEPPDRHVTYRVLMENFLSRCQFRNAAELSWRNGSAWLDGATWRWAGGLPRRRWRRGGTPVASR